MNQLAGAPLGHIWFIYHLHPPINLYHNMRSLPAVLPPASVPPLENVGEEAVYEHIAGDM